MFTSFLVACANQATAATLLIQQLQDVSVTIRAGQGRGSGVLFKRGEVTYVWTAAHVVDGLRKTRTIIVNGAPKVVVEFSDAQIVQEFRENGRRIGEQTMEARVVRYSDSEQGHDLALLEIRKRNFSPVTAVFYDGEIPEIGTELFHVGSLLGQFGANSLTTGVVSQIGRVLDLGVNGTVFDQTTVTAFPGSSGGGVYLKSDGRYIGMLVRGAGEGFNFIVPTRRMRQWADAAGIAWAMDCKLPMPSAEVLAKLSIEDAGVTFSTEKSAASKSFPTLLGQPLLPKLRNADGTFASSPE